MSIHAPMGPMGGQTEVWSSILSTSHDTLPATASGPSLLASPALSFQHAPTISCISTWVLRIKLKFLCLEGKCFILSRLFWVRLSLSTLAVSTHCAHHPGLRFLWSSCLSFPSAEIIGMNSQPLARRLLFLGNICVHNIKSKHRHYSSKGIKWLGSTMHNVYMHH